MTDMNMNCNSFTFYGVATTSTGGTAIAAAKLPDFDKYELIRIRNLHATDSIAFKTGTSAVTVGFPTAEDAATAMTIVGPGATVTLRKEKGHTNFAADSLAGSAGYTVQYGNGNI
jgi:hypothetical protein